MRYRMDIAQAAFASLSHLWMDHRLSRNRNLRLYNLCVCSTLTHLCEAWNLTKAVSRILNGFNNRFLHVIPGEDSSTVIPPFLQHTTCCWPYDSDVCSAHFCHLNHFCHSSLVLSIHINRFCQPHHFCQLLLTQSSPVLSTISTTYVATDEVITFVNKARPLLSTAISLHIYECYAQSQLEVIS